MLTIILLLVTSFKQRVRMDGRTDGWVQIPKTSKFNYVRLAVLFMVALLACNEFYEYCSNPGCSRLGQNLWLILAILQVTLEAGGCSRFRSPQLNEC